MVIALLMITVVAYHITARLYVQSASFAHIYNDYDVKVFHNAGSLLGDVMMSF